MGRPFHRRAPQNARLLREVFNVDYALLQCRLGVRMRGPFACDGGTGFRQSCAQRCEIIDPLRDHGLRLLVQTRGQPGAILRMIRTRPTARYKAMDTPTSAR